MEIWLFCENEKIQLPVLPEEFSITEGSNINTLNINKVGEMAIFGERKLSEVSFSSFFPSQQYPFCSYEVLKTPYDFIDLLNRWKNTKKPIRLVITGTSVNMQTIIENFAYGERDGTGDVYYELKFKQYRLLKLEGDRVEVDDGNLEREVKRETPSSHIVREGENLWSISKHYYNTADKVRELADKNNKEDINILEINEELMLV